MGVIGPWQLLVIVALVVIFFGGKKIPELMRGMGRGDGARRGRGDGGEVEVDRIRGEVCAHRIGKRGDDDEAVWLYGFALRSA